MSVHEIQRLHSRYSDLSNRFRAAWAFNQYLESLRKVFREGPRPDVSGGFQEVHGELKSISERLGAGDPEQLRDELDGIERRLGGLTSSLVEEDSRVPPELVRQFFRRVKNQGDNLLTQLVKFYVYSADPSTPWSEDRLDKVDFLLTRIAAERDGSGRFTLIERGRLREIVNGLWSLLRSTEPSGELVERSLEAIRELRKELSKAEGLDELNEQSLVPRYRELKHRLDRYFLHPKILAEVLETNLVCKNLIGQLYSVEERRIAAEYQRVFDLEQEVALDEELEAELRQFRSEVEVFERRLQHEDVKLDELGRLRSQVHSLSARLSERSRQGMGSGLDGGPPPVAEGNETPDAEVLVGPVARLREALAETDPEMAPARLVLTSGIFSLRLEAREVVAYRRLTNEEEPTGSREVEQTIVEAAALRVAINEQVEEIRALLDETSVTGSAPIFARARRTMRLAATYVTRLDEAMRRAVLYGSTAEAQALLVLRMRLVRDYTGCWLLAVKPLLGR